MSRNTMGPVKFLARSIATTPVLALVTMVLVAALTGLSAVVPVLADRASRATLAESVASVGPIARDLKSVKRGLPGPLEGTDHWAIVKDELAKATAEMPAPIASIVGEPRMQSMSVIGKSRRETSYPANLVTLLLDPDIADKVTIIEGREPQALPGRTWEIMLAGRVAGQLDWPIGEKRTVDKLTDATITLVGIFEPRDPSDPAWKHTPAALDAPLIMGTEDQLHQPFAIGAPGELEILKDETIGTVDTFSYWWPIKPEAITAENAQAVAQELRRFSAEPLPLVFYSNGWWQTGLTFSSQVPAAIEAATARSTAMTTIFITLVAGPLAVAAVALALAARMIALRRATAARLLLARGASRGWVGRILSVEGLILGLVGAATGAGVAIALVGWAGPIALACAVLFVLVPTIALPIATLSSVNRTERADIGGADVGHRRRILAIETGIVVLAGAVIALVLSRPSAGAELDPLLVLLPLAVAAIATALALRVLPMTLRIAEASGTRSRALTPLLGPASARRSGTVHIAPVLGVVVGISVAMTAVTLISTIDKSIETYARGQAGADMHITALYVEAEQADALGALPGVAAHTLVLSPAKIEMIGVKKDSITVYAVDPDGFAAAQRGMGAATIDVSPLKAAVSDAGVPLIFSRAAADTLGATDDVRTRGGDTIDVVDVTSQPSPFGAVRKWALVSIDNMPEIARVPTYGTDIMFALEPDADAAAIAAEATTLLGPVTIAEPAAMAAKRSADATLSAVRTGVLGIGATVLGLLAACVLMTLMLGARARSRLAGLLRTLGFPPRRGLSLVAWEVAPALAVAVPAGVIAGIASSYLLVPRIDVTGFVGGIITPTLMWNIPVQAIVVAGFVVLTAVAVVFTALAATGSAAANATRSVDEEGR